MLTVLLAIVISAFVYKQKEKYMVEEFTRKINSLENEIHTLKTNPFKLKDTSNRDAISIIEEFLYHNSFEEFSFISLEDYVALFEYEENGYIFTVRYSEKDFQMNIKKDGASLFEIDYCYKKEEYRTKEISRSLIKGDDEKTSLRILHELAEYAVWYKWTDLEVEFDIIDDTKEQINNIETFMEKIKKDSPDKEIKKLFSSATMEIQALTPYYHDFDIETKHFFETLATKDLPSLMKAYIRLSKTEKEKYRHEVITSITNMNKKLSLFKEKLNKEKVNDIDKVIELSKIRYKN